MLEVDMAVLYALLLLLSTRASMTLTSSDSEHKR